MYIYKKKHMYCYLLQYYIYGANMVKYTKKVLRYIKTINCFVKRLKVVPKVLFEFGFFFMVPSIVVLDTQV